MQMDIDVSASTDVNKCHGLCVYTLEITSAGAEDLSVDKLGNDMIEFQNIQDDRDRVIGSKPPYGKYDFLKKDKAIDNCFSKCETSSSTIACVEVALDADAIATKDSTPHENIKSLPTALELVSAMKGSREKRGVTLPQKLTVKWDPDVYDPVPTSVSHAATNNKPQKQNKKNSKSKQKTGSKSSHRNKHRNKLTGKGGGG